MAVKEAAKWSLVFPTSRSEQVWGACVNIQKGPRQKIYYSSYSTASRQNENPWQADIYSRVVSRAPHSVLSWFPEFSYEIKLSFASQQRYPAIYATRDSKRFHHPCFTDLYDPKRKLFFGKEERDKRAEKRPVNSNNPMTMLNGNSPFRMIDVRRSRAVRHAQQSFHCLQWITYPYMAKQMQASERRRRFGVSRL